MCQLSLETYRTGGLKRGTIGTSTAKEVKMTIRKLKNSAGIPGELFKHSGQHFTNARHNMICKIRSEEKILENYDYAHYTKRDHLEYQDITLMNKVLSNILYDKLKPYTEPSLGEYQAAFTAGR